jgi:hypothetical protein
VEAPAAPTGDLCSRCHNTPGVFLVRQVVSAQFGGWDLIAGPHAAATWCVACCWAHTTPELRSRPWTVQTGPSRTSQGAGGVAEMLRTGPLAPTVAVIVPISRHKHLLPIAAWGRVTTDDAVLPWTALDAEAFTHLEWFRDRGVTEAELMQPAPPFTVLAQPDVPLAEVWRRWGHMDRLRNVPRVMAVALRASRSERHRDSGHQPAS